MNPSAPSDGNEDALMAVTVAVSTPDDASSEQQEEVALVRQWADRLQRARDADKSERNDFDRWRRYAAGMPQKEKPDWLVDTNLIEATIEGLMPMIYARDPEIEVTPSDAVDESTYVQVRAFAKTLRIVVQRLLWDAKLKGRVRRAIRSVMTTGIGVLKVSMQLDSERDPEIERRINSLTDNLKRLDFLMRDQVDGYANPDMLDAERAEIESQIEALQSQVEVMVARGLVVDVLSTDNVQIDHELPELADYEYANWIAMRRWYTPEAAMEQFGLSRDQIGAATTYSSQSDDGNSKSTPTTTFGQRPETTSWLACWEIWDKRSTTVYTMIEGIKQWVRAPFPPTPSGRRFYPFFVLAFHYQDSRRWPLVPVKMWHKLQDEYARARSSYALHRQRAKPARIGDKSVFTPEDARKVSNPELNELVLVDRIDKSRPLQDAVAVMEYPRVDPSLYETSAVRADLEQVSGLSDAGRSAVVQPKTATEASILANGTVSRSGMKQDDVEDMIEDMACYVAELALQCMTLEDVRQFAGNGAVWPKLTTEQIHTLVDINVRAGTSGSPNQAQDRQTWTMLAPQIWQGITQIYQARGAGQVELADALTALLRITLEKFDIKIDINELIPKMEPQQLMGAVSGAEGQPMPPTAVPSQPAGPVHPAQQPMPQSMPTHPALPPLIFDPLQDRMMQIEK